MVAYCAFPDWGHWPVLREQEEERGLVEGWWEVPVKRAD
jgi:hypothetical protein